MTSLSRAFFKPVVIYSLPFPPSENQAYEQFFNPKTRVKTHYKSDKFKAYEKKCEAWVASRREIIGEIRQKMFAWIDARPDHGFKIDAAFCIPSKQLYTEQSKFHRRDPSNFVKQQNDFLVKIFGIDDCYFKKGSYEDVFTEGEKRVIVVISPWKVRGENELIQKIRQKAEIYQQIESSKNAGQSVLGLFPDA
jgi:Holliday junction resolvase RusA-like endonuclease